MSLDWTDEAWRERWADLAARADRAREAYQAEAERRMAQLLKPVVIEQLRVDVPLLGYDEANMRAAERTARSIKAERLDAALYFHGDIARAAASLYSQHAAGPDLPDHVPDPAAPDRDPG